MTKEQKVNKASKESKEKDIQKTIEMLKAGKNTSEIAKALGRQERTIRFWMGQHFFKEDKPKEADSSGEIVESEKIEEKKDNAEVLEDGEHSADQYFSSRMLNILEDTEDPEETPNDFTFAEFFELAMDNGFRPFPPMMLTELFGLLSKKGRAEANRLLLAIYSMCAYYAGNRAKFDFYSNIPAEQLKRVFKK